MNDIDARIEALDAMLTRRREQRNMKWAVNVFSGPPPYSYEDWEEWAATVIKTGAYIRASTPRDWSNKLQERRHG